MDTIAIKSLSATTKFLTIEQMDYSKLDKPFNYVFFEDDNLIRYVLRNLKDEKDGIQCVLNSVYTIDLDMLDMLCDFKRVFKNVEEHKKLIQDVITKFLKSNKNFIFNVNERDYEKLSARKLVVNIDEIKTDNYYFDEDTITLVFRP